MSGLETAIRNALDRAERGDGQVRARIYQSARQALDAGLRKQGVTDNLVIMQQRKRLEDKIREIEDEEIDRLAEHAQPPVGAQVDPFLLDPVARSDRSAGPWPSHESSPAVESATAHAAPDVTMQVEAPRAATAAAPAGSLAIGGVTRSGSVQVARDQVAADQALLDPAGRDHPAPPSVMPADNPAAYRDVPVAAPLPEAPDAQGPAGNGKVKADRKRGKPSVDAPVKRSARHRRKRSLLSHLITWIITLGVVAVGCWIFYQSGLVQSIIDDAMRSASRSSSLQSSGQGPSALSSRGGFSEEWADIFEPKDNAAFRAGAQAQAQIAAGSEGPALKVTSSSPTAAGDVAIEVPVEVLRELAGKSSTLAITVQSAGNQHSQLSVRCDFGSLGNCSRHRFTATQERQDALFKVSFDRTMAPNAPGRLIVNTGVGGAANPVFIYSVRALPGQ